MYIAKFDNCDRAFQVHISMLAELEKSNHFENLVLIIESGITKLKEISNQLGIKYKLQNNYCLLPFPKSERECFCSNTPLIYVTCLAAYNNGYHHGIYIDAARDADEIQEDINWMLSWSPVRNIEECEEWAIHDYENFEGIRLDEYENIETVSGLALALLEHGKAFTLFYENDYFDEISEAIERFEESYYGEYKSEEDFAYDFIEQCGWLDEKHPLYHYIDYERYARDLNLGGDFYYLNAGCEEVHVFANY